MDGTEYFPLHQVTNDHSKQSVAYWGLLPVVADEARHLCMHKLDHYRIKTNIDPRLIYMLSPSKSSNLTFMWKIERCSMKFYYSEGDDEWLKFCNSVQGLQCVFRVYLMPHCLLDKDNIYQLQMSNNFLWVVICDMVYVFRT